MNYTKTKNFTPFKIRVVCLFFLMDPFLLFQPCFSADMQVCEFAVKMYCKDKKISNYKDSRRYIECLKKNTANFSAQCREEVQEMVKEYEEEIEPCVKDYLNLCGVDLIKGSPRDESWWGCMVKKWDQFSAACRKQNEIILELSGMSEDELAQANQHSKDSRPVQIKETSQTATALLQEGDLIWYPAKIKVKKIIERYPFCPPVKDKSLKLTNAPQKGSCGYEVTAPWQEELVKELRDKNVFDFIDNSGARNSIRIFHQSQRDYFQRKKSDDAEYNEWVNAMSIIEAILDKYSVNCPRQFEADISNRRNFSKEARNFLKNYDQKFRPHLKGSDPQPHEMKEMEKLGWKPQWVSSVQYVTCEGKTGNYDECPEGYQKSHYSQGYFGCVKLESCHETNKSFYDLYDTDRIFSCAFCSAGGCLDQDVSHQLDNILCKVNYKEPVNTPECPEYRIERQYNGNVLGSERFYKISELIKSNEYDNRGNLERIVLYKNGNPVKAYSTDGTLLEGILKVYCRYNECIEARYDEKTKTSQLLKRTVYDRDRNIEATYGYEEGVYEDDSKLRKETAAAKGWYIVTTYARDGKIFSKVKTSWNPYGGMVSFDCNDHGCHEPAKY